jgi:hypothetical protein
MSLNMELGGSLCSGALYEGLGLATHPSTIDWGACMSPKDLRTVEHTIDDTSDRKGFRAKFRGGKKNHLEIVRF